MTGGERDDADERVVAVAVPQLDRSSASLLKLLLVNGCCCCDAGCGVCMPSCDCCMSVGCATNRTSFTFSSNLRLHSSGLTANSVDSTSSVKPHSWPSTMFDVCGGGDCSMSSGPWPPGPVPSSRTAYGLLRRDDVDADADADDAAGP